MPSRTVSGETSFECCGDGTPFRARSVAATWKEKSSATQCECEEDLQVEGRLGVF